MPDRAPGQSDARAETAAANNPPGAPTHPPEPTPEELQAAANEQLRSEIRSLIHGKPAQLHPITFVGAEKLYIRRSSHPPVARSVGIVNPTEFQVFAGLSGERAAPNSAAFIVPAKRAMVIPVAVDKFDLGVDPEALKEASATIFLLRFETVQPFFLGAM